MAIFHGGNDGQPWNLRVPNLSIFSANLSGRAQLLQPRRYATSKDVDTIDNNAVDWRWIVNDGWIDNDHKWWTMSEGWWMVDDDGDGDSDGDGGDDYDADDDDDDDDVDDDRDDDEDDYDDDNDVMTMMTMMTIKIMIVIGTVTCNELVSILRCEWTSAMSFSASLPQLCPFMSPSAPQRWIPEFSRRPVVRGSRWPLPRMWFTSIASTILRSKLRRCESDQGNDWWDATGSKNTLWLWLTVRHGIDGP